MNDPFALQALHLTPAPEVSPRHWRLGGRIAHLAANGDTLLVDAGYVTDGASIPRWLWTLVGPPLADARVAFAAALHDALYDTRGAWRYTRRECDSIFDQALRHHGFPRATAALYHLGVRLGGGVGWRRVTPARQRLALPLVRIVPGA